MLLLSVPVAMLLLYMLHFVQQFITNALSNPFQYDVCHLLPPPIGDFDLSAFNDIVGEAAEVDEVSTKAALQQVMANALPLVEPSQVALNHDS